VRTRTRTNLGRAIAADELADWPAKERREPSLFSPFYLELRELMRVLRHAIATQLAGRADLRLVDIGCARKPYFPLFFPHCGMYVGIDVNPHCGSPDCIARMEALPFGTASMDVALCTQAIAYSDNPWLALAEANRVLKPGGLIFLSTHGVHPYLLDSWHFTAHGLRQLLVQTGFGDIRILPNGGAALCFFQILAMYLNVPRDAIRVPLLRIPLSALMATINVAGLIADGLLSRRGGENWSVNYLAVARKDCATVPAFAT
jgi:SAM-dependent methyltransferase